MKNLICLMAAVMVAGCSGLENHRADLKAAYAKPDSKSALLQAPRPDFTDPVAYTSVYLVQCPKCGENQFLMPKFIHTIGAVTRPDGILQTKAVYFECETKRCNTEIRIPEDVLVPPVKAIRVR